LRELKAWAFSASSQKEGERRENEKSPRSHAKRVHAAHSDPQGSEGGKGHSSFTEGELENEKGIRGEGVSGNETTSKRAPKRPIAFSQGRTNLRQ